MTRPPALSLITPTFRRHAHLEAAHRGLLRQSLGDFEWLILDDGPEPSPHFLTLDDPRVRYRHHPGPRMSVGAKRNLLVAEARAEIVAHIDDDDYYAPRYLETMAGFIGQGADLAKLSAFFLFSKRLGAFGYWDLERLEGLRFVWSKGPVEITDLSRGPNPETWRDMNLGYGFSYVYKKTLWEATPFEDVNFNEDLLFARACVARDASVALIQDKLGLALHILHGANTSLCLPQFSLPPFALTRFFPVEVMDQIEVPETSA